MFPHPMSRSEFRPDESHPDLTRLLEENLLAGPGTPLTPRDGPPGACLQTRQPQLSVDTEFDPRVDPAISRRLGIRSILVVPVLDINNAQFTGVLEVFSTSPAAFSNSDQKLLEGFAEECARIRPTAIERGERKPAAAFVRPEPIPPKVVPPKPIAPELMALDSASSGFAATSPQPARRSPY